MAAKDEVDIDQYLDDVLEEFNDNEPMQINAKSTKPGPEEVLEDQEAFMKLLQENMAKLMGGEIGDSEEVLEAMGKPVAPAASMSTPPAIPSADDFQDTISQTLNKLKSSSHQAQSKAKSKSTNPTHDLFGAMDGDSMEQMMKELEGMMDSGDFEDMFGGLMNSLASKDLLYEPMKDLANKYPEWLEENKTTLSTDELGRYKAQHRIVLQIVEVFDKCETNEPNEEESQRVIDLMQEMQTFGNPPEGMMKNLVPGMESAAGGEDTAMPSECKNM